MQRNQKWWWAVLLCCSSQMPTAQAAATGDFLEMSLEELVDYRLMSMSRKEQRVADMAAAAHVVSAEDIRRSGATSIPEALRLVPGLNVAQISSNTWAVSARGFNNRLAGKLLVLVDGRNIYSPSFSGVLWESQDLVMEDIERIEVIRGPGAALWGTNAMNGVINIVTRSAAANQGPLVSSTIGTGAMTSTTLRQGGELSGGGYYSVYGKQSRTGNSIESDTGNHSNDGAHRKSAGIRIEPEVQGAQLTLQAEVHQSRSSDVWSMPAVSAYSDPSTPYIRQSRLTGEDTGGSLQARYAWKGEQGTENLLQAFVDHESSKYRGLWGTGTVPGSALGQAPTNQTVGGDKTDVDIEFQQRRVGGAHDFIWGANLRHTSDNLLLPAGPYLLRPAMDRRVNYSAFVHDEISLSPDRFKLILGSKFEHDGLTGFNVQPNVRTLFTPNAYEAFWTGLSRSMRSTRRSQTMSTIDVSANDASVLLGQPLPVPLTGVVQISPMPGSHPQAEEAVSLEGGWRRQFSNFLSVDTALFVTDYSHLSGARIGDPTHNINQAVACAQNPTNYTSTGLSRCYLVIPGYSTNADKARAWGGEFAFEWHARSWWKVQTSYSHVRVKGVYTNDDAGNSVLRNAENSTPRHQIMVNNHFLVAPQWSLNLQLRYSSHTTYYPLGTPETAVVPSYTGLNARLAWQVNRQTELSIMGRNLLKDRHAEFISTLPYTRAYDMRRSVLAQAVVRF